MAKVTMKNWELDAKSGLVKGNIYGHSVYLDDAHVELYYTALLVQAGVTSVTIGRTIIFMFDEDKKGSVPC